MQKAGIDESAHAGAARGLDHIAMLGCPLADFTRRNEQQRVDAVEGNIKSRGLRIVGRPRGYAQALGGCGIAREGDDLPWGGLILQRGDHEAAQLAGGTCNSNHGELL